ncbi:bicaudal C homolog 1-A-like protein [Tanacetum coccineum]
MSDQPPPPPPPPDTTTTPQLNGTTTIPPPQTTTANPPKRHRRPSVRLGDIGYHHRRFPAKSSKTKQLIQDPFEYKDENNTHWKPKKGTKRIKSNFGQHPFQYNHHNDNDNDNESLNFAMDDDENDINFDDDDGENEELKEIRVRVSDGAPSDNGLGLERNGVRVWLNQIGLGRYAHVFELHEVDDEVLPLLTLEDLKDMGINAVGSRRKMFCSIQKLGKGFS